MEVVMSLGDVLGKFGPFIEPLLEKGVEELWPKLDAEIASMKSEELKLILIALSPALKTLVLAEIKKIPTT